MGRSGWRRTIRTGWPRPFALNEGGGGRTDGHGKLLVENMQVGEKAVQNYSFETVNAGGHSSIPIRENAIYELAESLCTSPEIPALSVTLVNVPFELY